MNAMAGNKILQTSKSPWPANKVRGRNEPGASDAVKAQVSVINNGSVVAQLFIGHKSPVDNAYRMKSEAAFINTIEDNS